MSDPFSDVEPTGIISGSINFSEGRMEEKGELDHYIGVATSSDETAGGAGYTQSGFHLQDTRRLKVLKFYGMRVQTLEIQSIEAKFGFQ